MSDTVEILHTPRRLAPVSQSTGPWAPSPVAWFADRLWLAENDRIVSATVGSSVWQPAFRADSRKLEAALAETAKTLGLVAARSKAAGTRLPGCFGIGPLSVLQAPGDDVPCLYAVTRSIWGARILRCESGRQFDDVPVPPDLGTMSRIALTGLAVAGDWAVTATAPAEGASPRQRLPMGEAKIFASRGSMDEWQPAAEPGFGAEVFGGVTALAPAHGRIYAAVEDVHRGFDLWSAEVTDSLPWIWTRAIARGGHRFSQAPRVTAMTAFNGELYLAAAISESGFGSDGVGPAGAELLRVRADGEWELVIGAPRFSPDGLKVPLAGLPPGFGDPYASAVLCLSEVGGKLYAGTRNTQAESRLLAEPDHHPTPTRLGGARIWTTETGNDWQPVAAEGHHDPSITGIRAVFEGPNGLATAATANLAVAGSLEDPPVSFHAKDIKNEAMWIRG